MKVTRSSGNVFRDLGFPPEEAANLTVRSMLMIEIKKHIQAEKLTQKKAAKLFGVSQPRISDLVRGKISLFSVDTLISMLTHAGLKVDVKVRRSAA
jgi:predicted XRE-type DNA-binding protein